MMYTLLACPFCGHQPDEENLLDSIHPMKSGLWTAGCVDNEGGCNASVFAGSRDEAIALWNRRTPMNWRDALRLRNAVNRD